MGPRFLLDEHISPRVSEHARRLGVDVACVAGTPLREMEDPDLLREAARQRRILVTYDVCDLAVLLPELIREGVDVPGLVFVSHATIPASKVSTLARSLARLASRVASGEVSCVLGIYLR